MELEIIKNSILEIRGKKVMLDMDLAKLYEVETRVLKQAVRRNIERFPMDFMFELNENEIQNLTSHFVTTSWGGQRHKPFAFTEQGIAMLSSVLKSKKAIHMNISIMRAFVMMRQWAITLIADFDTHATAYYSACLISPWTECPEGLYRRPSAIKPLSFTLFRMDSMLQKYAMLCLARSPRCKTTMKDVLYPLK